MCNDIILYYNIGISYIITVDTLNHSFIGNTKCFYEILRVGVIS